MERAARLYYIEGLSYLEIAEDMGIGYEGAKSHLRWFRLTHGLSSRRDAIAWFRTHRVSADA